MLTLQFEQPRGFDFINQHWDRIRLTAVPFLILGLLGVYGLVYATGGVKYVYSHSMYLVILTAGFLYGISGGMLAGLAGGIVLGPYMPIEVATGEMQATVNWLYRTAFFTLAGLLTGSISNAVDRYIKALHLNARVDRTTGLRNRFHLTEKLRQMAGKDNTVYSGLAILSLENADEIEAAYGPHVTDHIVVQLIDSFSTKVGRGVSFYRTSARHVAALISRRSDEDVRAILQLLLSRSNDAVCYGEVSLHVDARLGYSAIDILDDDPEQLLRQAEVALSNAYRKNRRLVHFSPDMEGGRTKENLFLLGQLKAALSQNQLSLHYQPKVDIATEEVTGVEALMRWQHPDLGNIPPGKFIPRAEQSTLIGDLTDWALDTAIRQLAEWYRQGWDLTIAVNVSSQNLLQDDFSESVLEVLKKYDVPAQKLELEVTESAFMTDLEGCVKKLTLLADAGVVLSIDDFGTGYSSLQYLNYLPVSYLKVDRSFVQTLDKTSGSAPIVTGIISTAHALKLKVIAEGVEEMESYEYLKHLGCDEAQGYLISRPMPIAQFTEWYRENKGGISVLQAPKPSTHL